MARINGRSVDSVSGAEEAFRHPIDGLHRIEFAADERRGEIVLDATDFAAATRRILEAYGVPGRARTRPPEAALATPECEPADDGAR